MSVYNVISYICVGIILFGCDEKNKDKKVDAGIGKAANGIAKRHNDSIKSNSDTTIKISVKKISLEFEDTLKNEKYALRIVSSVTGSGGANYYPKTGVVKPVKTEDEVFYALKTFSFKSVAQNVYFEENSRVIRQITNRTLYDDKLAKRIKDCCSEIHAIIDGIMLLKGKVNDLYVVQDNYGWGGALSLYTMRGDLLWFEFDSKESSCRSGNVAEILVKNGISKDAMNNLDTLKSIVPVHGEL